MVRYVHTVFDMSQLFRIRSEKFFDFIFGNLIHLATRIYTDLSIKIFKKLKIFHKKKFGQKFFFSFPHHFRKHESLILIDIVSERALH